MAAAIADEVPRAPVITRRQHRLLLELLDILSLEHVDNPDRDECHHFARIDPADPVVEEICLPTDELHEARRPGTARNVHELGSRRARFRTAPRHRMADITS
ncbi:hypothetical protein [uncultured Paracoccus sp.]|uniref:hypothetical protein n=1 Tax=uncultured Paracoccus sp. TaxID=189685 RepID=UPI00260C4BE8|nr:hypothetical protein [uncultured Paracoccus sp.]